MSVTQTPDDDVEQLEDKKFGEDAPLDQVLIDSSVRDPSGVVNSVYTRQADHEFESAVETVKEQIAVVFDFDPADPELREKADVDPDSTDRTEAENKEDSTKGVSAELLVQTYLRELGFECKDTEHFDKVNGDLVVEGSGTTVEVKARDMDNAYNKGFDDFPIRYEGFEADVGVLVLVAEDSAVIVAWEHGEELGAFTRAYTPSDLFHDDATEGGRRWVYPYARTHSINTLPAYLRRQAKVCKSF